MAAAGGRDDCYQEWAWCWSWKLGVNVGVVSVKVLASIVGFVRGFLASSRCLVRRR